MFVVAALMGVAIDLGSLARLLLLAPFICVTGGALGIVFIGVVHDPRLAGVASFLLVFPQMFLSGALIPVNDSTGILGLLTHLMPLTYAIDLAVTVGFFLLFSIAGTILFARSERNR